MTLKGLRGPAKRYAVLGSGDAGKKKRNFTLLGANLMKSHYELLPERGGAAGAALEKRREKPGERKGKGESSSRTRDGKDVNTIAKKGGEGYNGEGEPSFPIVARREEGWGSQTYFSGQSVDTSILDEKTGEELCKKKKQRKLDRLAQSRKKGKEENQAASKQRPFTIPHQERREKRRLEVKKMRGKNSSRSLGRGFPTSKRRKTTSRFLGE